MTTPIIHTHRQDRNWRDQILVFAGRWIIRPSLAVPFPWSGKRRSFALAGWSRPMAPGVRCEKLKIAGRTGVVYTPAHPTCRIIWIHGGGFVVGSPRSHKGMLSHLAKAANAAIFVPKYRLAPEHPFPAAVEDVEAAFDAIDDFRADLGPLVLGGDSAGATLAASCLARALAHGSPKFAAVMLISPAANLDAHREVPKANDVLFPLQMFRRIIHVYGASADPLDPRLSPAYADFTGSPAVLIHCCAGEYLEVDSDILAAKFAADGAQVNLDKYQSLPHVFHFMAGFSPTADKAVQSLAEFARHHVKATA